MASECFNNARMAAQVARGGGCDFRFRYRFVFAGKRAFPVARIFRGQEESGGVLSMGQQP
jgi:hypothetical protein